MSVGDHTPSCARDLQATKGKDKHKSPLLVNRKIARPNRLHRQQQDENIGGDGKPSVGIPVHGQTDTSRSHRLIPGPTDWRALEDRGGGCCNHVGEDDAEEDVATDAEPALDEDAKIQQQDRCFREVDGEFVEDLGNVEKLETRKSVCVGQYWPVYRTLSVIRRLSFERLKMCCPKPCFTEYIIKI